MNALLTDFYQLTMAAGYFEAGKQHDHATFELFARRLPSVRQHLVVAGLQQAVEYLEGLRFRTEEISWLRSLPQFAQVREEFWSYLRDFRFTGTVFAMPEGTLAYASEPLLSVRAPLIEAQLVETFLLATVGFQTMIASAAARIVEAAGGRSVVEFGTRRAHSPQAGLYAARAAYIGGCIGTSNALAGFQFGIPVFGTAAHSWVLSFSDEREAFARLQQLLGERCVYLIDTHDTLEGARQAAALGRPLWGVRLDSGDLVTLSRQVRQILDQAGLTEAKVMATNELDEAKIRAVVEAGAPIDSFGVGTALATSSDAPSLGMVYKLVEITSGGRRRDVAKLSPEKQTVPGAKQVFRYDGLDVIARADECKPLPGECQALLQPVLMNGERMGELPLRRLDRFPLPQPQWTRLSDSLEALGQ